MPNKGLTQLNEKQDVIGILLLILLLVLLMPPIHPWRWLSKIGRSRSTRRKGRRNRNRSRSREQRHREKVPNYLLTAGNCHQSCGVRTCQWSGSGVTAGHHLNAFLSDVFFLSEVKNSLSLPPPLSMIWCQFTWCHSSLICWIILHLPIFTFDTQQAPQQEQRCISMTCPALLALSCTGLFVLNL